MQIAVVSEQVALNSLQASLGLLLHQRLVSLKASMKEALELSRREWRALCY